MCPSRARAGGRDGPIELGAAFADVWCAIPKVVFSRTLDSVQGNARLAEGSVAEEAAAALDATATSRTDTAVRVITGCPVFEPLRAGYGSEGRTHPSEVRHGCPAIGRVAT
jgi:hypothetical protein